MKFTKKTVRASRTAMRPRTKRIMADTDVAPEAADLLFEAEEVAQLVAEVTGEDVAVEADGTSVTFDVAGETYTCEADEETEEVEASRKVSGCRPVKASRTVPNRARKPVARRR